ncbi:MAG: carbamoyltransferase [Candidatus Aenigmarchaeota archaeon]|nr:carbamoyltransferase [Candidatus Aenigmarchaeota archaeon]
MYFLGLSGMMHDPAACLVKNNEVIAFVEEERFNRIKHSPKAFPAKSISFCLKTAGIKLSDVDNIGFHFNPSYKNLFWKRKSQFLRGPEQLVGTPYLRAAVFNFVNSGFKKNFNYSPKVEYIDHHMAHAASSFYLSGFKDATILTIDGAGESTATMAAYGSGEKIEVIKEFAVPNSLGIAYMAITEWLGFQAFEGEGKVMGLAPYGKRYLKIFDEIIKKNPDGYKFDHRYDNKAWSYSDFAIDMLGKARLPSDKTDYTAYQKNIAYSIQHKLEEIVKHLVENFVEDTGSKNLCLAGGVALNSKMNGEILYSGLIDDIFIQPASNDAGNAIGCAVKMAVDSGNRFDKMEHIYYGPEYSDDYLKKILQMLKVEAAYHTDIAGKVAELLAKGKIVGWFQGRMEGGPRALGNRSILADPRDPKMKDTINFYVKHREAFRPFCPSVLDEKRSKYFEVDREAPFMILIQKVPEDVQKDIPAVVHTDGTMRSQTVRKDQNPKYHKLISEFYKLTSVPVLLNTSFNVAGEPIVNTPQEAIADFYREGIDALAIGNYLLTK